MQLTLLNLVTNPYLAGQIINDYSSLIWTERFRDYGEFQMNIPRNAMSASIFWPGQLLGIGDSGQVMMAETQQERINDAGYREVIVTGRSADAIIEDRVLWASQTDPLTLARRYSWRDAALLYIWQAVVNSSVSDVAYTVNRPSEISTSNQIPSAIVTDSTSGTSSTTNKLRVSPGQIGPLVRTFLNSANCSIRCIRPPSTIGTAMKITVDITNTANRGLITRSTPSASDAASMLRFDIYNGTDRSKSTASNFVGLSVEAGHLDNANVATTYREFVTNVVHGIDTTHYYGSTTPTVASSSYFAPRHRFVDASSMVQGAVTGDYPEIIDAAEKVYYREHLNRALLDADLVEGSAFQYGVHYFLGDTVLLKYKDRTRRVLVNEFTRVDDLEGRRTYPGFLAWDEIDGYLRDW